MTDIPALLQPLKDRLAAATPGPWHQGRDSNRWENSREVYSEREVSATSRDICTSVDRPEDAALISHAPTDQAKLIAAIEAMDSLAAAWQARGEHLKLSAEGAPEDVQESLDDQGADMIWHASLVRDALTQALGG